MNDLFIASICLFLLSIISFFVKNGNKQLTRIQIIQLSGRNFKKPALFKNYPDVLLMFSIIALILFFDYPGFIEIAVGILIIFTQKVLILILQRVMPKGRT